MRWARPGNDPERERRGGGAGGILGIVPAPQRADAADARERSRLAAGLGFHDAIGLGVEPMLEPPQHRDSRHVLAGPFEPVCDFLRPFVVDTDDGGAVRRNAFDQPRLDGRITLDRAVPIEMVRRDIEQDADRRVEARREIDLIGRALDHVGAARGRRIEREDRNPDVAAALRFDAACAEHVGDERRRRRFAVGPGHRHERRPGGFGAALATIELDVADDLDRGPAGERDAPMRRRIGERNAGREHERGDAGPVDLPEIAGGNAAARRHRDLGRIVVEGDHLTAAGFKRLAARKPGAAEPEHGHFFAREGRDRDHAGSPLITAA